MKKYNIEYLINSKEYLIRIKKYIKYNWQEKEIANKLILKKVHFNICNNFKRYGE